jgi:HAD superfamily hydrolase (TIGR01549 family)
MCLLLGVMRPTGSPMTTAILFDIDGTLLDSNDLHARAWVEVFRQYGYDVSVGAVRRQIGKGADKLMPVFLPEDVIQRDGEKMKKERVALFREKYLPHTRVFPKVRELFERLAADGKKVALASSATGPELKEYKERLGVADLLDAQTSADDAERSKPDPDIFLAAVHRLGDPDRDQTVVVGDTPYDAEAGRNAGLRVVGVTCGGWSTDDLRAAGCVAVYRDPADLLAHYEQSPLR